MQRWRTPVAWVLALIVALGTHNVLCAKVHTGQVTAGGTPVPGANVVATRGERRVTTTTNADGIYRFADLDDGLWTIRVEMRGFASEERTVTTTDDPGGAEERWELKLLSLEEIERAGTVFGSLQAAAARTTLGAPAESPSPSRAAAPPERPSQAPPPPPRAAPPGRSASAPPPGEPSVIPVVEESSANPLFGATDSFLVNGSVLNAAASPLSQSRAIGNVRLSNALRMPYTFSAAVGGRSSAIDARPFGVPAKPNNRNLNFSGTVSGPIRLPWLLQLGPPFALTFSRADSYDARSLSLFLPTARERLGDFSQSVDAFGRPVQVTDPDTGFPFPGGIVTPARISEQARALLAYYPPINNGDERGNYLAAAITEGHTDSLTFRLNTVTIDTLTQLDNVSVGYARGATKTVTPFTFEDLGRTANVSASIGITRRLTPSLLLRVRENFSRASSRTEPHFANRVNVSALAGISGNNQDTQNWGPPTLTFRTIAPLSSANHAASRRLTNLIVGEANWTRRRHAIVFGGEIERRQSDLISQQNPRGTFFFSGAQTGSDVADFLLGLPASSTIAFGNADKYFRQLSYAAFVTDDWRIGPSFTVNLGVRWEYEAPVTEARDRLVNLDVEPGFARVTPVLATDLAGSLTGARYGRSLVRPDRLGIQPRIAVAWRPILGSSVIVRAGYGIYRNTNVYEAIAQRLAQQPPLSVAASAERTDRTPITLANGFVASPTITQVPWAIDPDFRVGYAHNWQATIQRDFPGALQISASYVGVKGSRLPQVFLPNTEAPGTIGACIDCPTGFQYLRSGGTSSVHRGQIQVRRRLRAGLEASAQYSRATGEDNASALVGIAGTPAQDWRDLAAERGPSPLIRRHEFGARITYTSSLAIENVAWLRTMLGGWMVSGDITAAGGYPLTPVYATTIPGTTVTSAIRPRLTGEPLSAIPAGYYLNPAAFGPPAAGEWGDAGRGSIVGPNTFVVDTSLSRGFRLNTRGNLTWRASVTNLLNQARHSTVNTSLGSPQFGLPTGFVPPRRVNLQLQMTFR